MIRCVWRPGCHASVGGRWASFSFLGRSCQFVRLWQPDNEKEMTLQPPHKDWAKTCSFSPDSVHLVSGGDDRTLMVWNVESCQLVRVSIGIGSKPRFSQSHMDYSRRSGRSPVMLDGSPHVYGLPRSGESTLSLALGTRPFDSGARIVHGPFTRFSPSFSRCTSHPTSHGFRCILTSWKAHTPVVLCLWICPPMARGLFLVPSTET